MGSYVIDSVLLKDWFGTKRAREIFSDENLVQKWLDFEAALARAEGDMGIIPKEAANEICKKAKFENLDFVKMKNEFDNCGHPLVPMISAFKNACDGNAGQYIHWGTTTQDVMDTGMVLQMRELYDEIYPKLLKLIDNCKKIAEENKNLVMAGRTHGQHALPITFGFKVATWVAELERNKQRLEECKKRVFIGQFFGAAGTLAGVGKDGIKLMELTMKYLDLSAPPINWHAARDGIAEYMAVLGLLTGSVARIANEVINLQKTEYSELEEPFKMGNIGSSTMPHKRNPLYCQRLVALSKMVRANVGVAMEGMVGDHERDLRFLAAEWAFIGQTCIMTDAVMDFGVYITSDLIVKPQNMDKNLNILNGLMLSENLMFKIAEKIGRQNAHEVVYKICMEAFEKEVPLIEELLKDEQISGNFSKLELEDILDARHYIGLSVEFVDNVLKG